MKTVQVKFTDRELTLVRVACLKRLTDLKRVLEKEPTPERQASYDDTLAMMTNPNGILFKAMVQMSGSRPLDVV